MKNKQYLIAGLFLGLLGSVIARTDRTLRNELRAATKDVVHADYETRLKKAETLEAIAAAQRESSVLMRNALTESWAQREAKRFERDTMRGRFAHLYASPAWLTSLQRFFGSHSLFAAYSFSAVEKGFDAEGAVVDASAVRFARTLKLEDILVASKMAGASEATPGVGYEFLTDLRNVELPFQVATTTHECAISYALGFAKNTFQCGFRLPIRYQTRRMAVVPHLSSAEQALIRETTEDEVLRNSAFRGFYGVSVPSFIADVIAQKGMRYQEYLSKTAVGDMSLFGTIHFYPWRLDRVSVSFEALMPTEKNVESEYFYPFMPESQGCFSGRLSVGMVAKKTVIGSPHFMASLRMYAPASLSQRVPRIIRVDGVTALPSAEVFGQEVTFGPARDIAIAETVVPDFASAVANATIRPGFAVDVRFGTIISPFLTPLLQCDFYYNFHARGSDELRQGLAQDRWYATSLLAAPRRMRHSVGLLCSYQAARGVAVNAGGEVVVAGRSLPLEARVTISISKAW